MLRTPFAPTKLLSYTLDFFVSKWLSDLFARLEIWGSKSNIFMSNFLYQEVFRYCNFQGRFGIVVFIYFKSYTYNYLVNGQRSLILPKLETQTIILGRRV